MSHALIQPGATIAGKYRIIRALGEGGMGMVYMARHELLDRTVAIKVLHAQFEHRELAVKRFQREIKAMALVQSPYIAQAVDAGALESGALYLAMEYLEGHNLRAELKQRRAIPHAEAVAYVMQACAGVAAVHDVGIIHRDLKPHNLFLTELQGARRIKVLDFGIAKFIDGTDAGMTDSEVAVGTPLYMAPEQLTRPEEISRRTDVWALAVVLYELIAGVSPFAANTPGAVVAAVVLQDPIPLSFIVPEVPQPLARVIAKALSKSPAQRTSGVKELAEELAPFGMPLDGIVVPTPTRSWRALPALERVSVRPELAARIEKEVEAFEPDGAPSSSGAPAHVVRQLPSLAKLALAPDEEDIVPEPLYLRETAEQPLLLPNSDSPAGSPTSSQPTTILRNLARAPDSASDSLARSEVRLRAGVALGLLVLCAVGGVLLMSWRRGSAPTVALPPPATSFAAPVNVTASDRLVVNDIAPLPETTRAPTAIRPDERVQPRSGAPATRASFGRGLKANRAATPSQVLPTTAPSSAAQSKPLHL